MIDNFLQAADMIAGAIIVGIGICQINNMGPSTRHDIRFGYVALTVGGMALVLGPMYLTCPVEWFQVVGHSGLALIMLADRRGKCETLCGEEGDLMRLSQDMVRRYNEANKGGDDGPATGT